jgi:c-di-GMP-binding flagellar brake protein YcgR
MSSGEKGNLQSPPVRSYNRYAAYRDLAIAYEGYSEKIPVRAPDISASGMFINTGRRFPEGAIIKVRFRLTRSSYEINARAEVRYCLPGVGIGVEFIEISEADRRAILDEIQVEESLPPINQAGT